MNDQSLRDKVREETLREVLGVLPNPLIYHYPAGSAIEARKAIQSCHDAVQSLLPKPDRAAELVERWRKSGAFEYWSNAQYDATRQRLYMDDAFARWLISEGIVL